jgi:glutamine---fructose-6-phosphate transaminase (isomerizing)
VARHLVEEWAELPCEVDVASEFRYRHLLLDAGTLVVPISQSGETADTLAALQAAQTRGALTLAICNVVGSSLAREAHATLFTRAGLEIGVASTKAFTTQLAALHLLALSLGAVRGRLTCEQVRTLTERLGQVPAALQQVLESYQSRIGALVDAMAGARDVLYLGRGIHYPIALEGALKLKEISYLHAEGFPAGEMKHGPIALIDDAVPVVVLAPQGRTYEKVRSNLEEVRARGGRVLLITTHTDHELDRTAAVCLSLPKLSEPIMPILESVPLQLLAYHVAVAKGCNVDQPRNLAKSVTVE